MNTDSRRRLAALVCLVALFPLPGLAEEPPGPAEGPPQGEGLIVGRVVEEDGRTPVPGVTVLCYHLRHLTTYRGEPSDRRGAFKIPDLPYGYYELAVETPDGFHPGNLIVNVPPSGRAIVTLTLAPFAPNDDATRGFSGATEEASGVARVDEQLTKKEFWKSPRGLAIVGGIGGAVLLWVAASDNNNDDEIVVSPILPSAPAP